MAGKEEDMNKTWTRVKRLLGLEKRTPEEKKRFDQANMQGLGIVSIILIVLETIVLICSFILKGHYGIYPHWLSDHRLAYASQILLGIIMMVLSRRVAKSPGDNHIQGLVLMSLFAFFTILFGVFISALDCATGEQAFVFFTMVISVICLMYFLPLVSAFILTGSTLLFALLLSSDALFARYNLTAPGISFATNVNLAIFTFVVFVISVARFASRRTIIMTELALEQKNRELMVLSYHDELTGTLNRHSLTRHVSRELGKTFQLVMFDINGFKLFNDLYGHATGDAVLVAISERLMKLFGREHVYRYGGDEFLVLFAGESEEEFLKMFKKWKDMNGNYDLDGKTFLLTCSFGLARGLVQTEEDFNRLLAQSDRELFKAKKSRRG